MKSLGLNFLRGEREREEGERRHTERREKMTNHSANGIRLSRSLDSCFTTASNKVLSFFFVFFLYLFYFFCIFFFFLLFHSQVLNVVIESLNVNESIATQAKEFQKILSFFFFLVSFLFFVICKSPERGKKKTKQKNQHKPPPLPPNKKIQTKIV